MRLPMLLLAATAALSTALPAAAQFRNAEAAVKYRQSVMQVQGFHLGRIFAMANGRMPFDAKVVAEDAAVLDVIDKLPFMAFGDGTDAVAGSNSKPEVWRERAKFDGMAVKMQDEVTKLVSASKVGTVEAVRPAVGAVAASCKACHDAYQKQ